MSFIRKIFSGKSKKMDLSSFAQLPLKLMDTKSPPFDDWKDPDVDVPEDLRQMFNLYTWLYQLFMFYMLTSDALGNEMAVRVVELQDKAEGDILGSTMFNIYENMNNIKTSIEQLIESPIVEDMEGEQTEMPLEYGLAKKFLFSGEFSPLKFKEENVDLGEVANLGLCLFHAKQPAIAYFEALLSKIELNKNA